ncbi:hypothetical protein CLHOM_15280 [Clostridium homopropionicum DSM 5847]|uniref:Uncharacterized protein n=1 Tax=Clostridium homopropionicum DSM 5847 TaxID=1121318 RepID=A0A0L6ZBB1_9CLOT|nr:DUF523 domain-containing protein [Clostridium homopropionicum]KOA20098.1 hypothetical protein CLHOM_15280 [Clostridium homopropionicum DSM 5847]SFG86648.1 Uncharacterized conserved protein YbbK, DUF523 family [Clostridium homopropionicum]
MKKILVSGCLYGWHVRYDDGDIPCLDKRFLKWKEEGRLIPVCPEVFGGLTIPRPDSQRVGSKVIACTGVDVTKEYELGAIEAVRLAKENDVVVCIMKQDSPSCGSKYIYDGTFTDTKIEGQGRAVQLLRESGFVVLDENDLDKIEKLIEEN